MTIQAIQLQRIARRQPTAPDARLRCVASRCTMVAKRRSSGILAALTSVSSSDEPITSRRSALIGSSVAAVLIGLPPTAQANPLQDLLRGAVRPDIAPEQAVGLMLEASSTLKQIAALAATAADSDERFNARALLPGWATRLRRVQEAAPVVAALIAGSSDRESTLSYIYGGTGGVVEGEGSADAVYIALGRVLTISGRTIRKEAQATPDNARYADKEIEEFLAKVPRDIYNIAVAKRKARSASTVA